MNKYVIINEQSMKNLNIEEIKLILQNRDIKEQKYFSVFLIPYINNMLFIENASLLRNLSGLSFREIATHPQIGISPQALSQFEKRKEFPVDKIEKLFQIYLEIAVSSAFNGNKLLLNFIYTLFFFTTIDFPLNLDKLKTKEQTFQKLKEHINEDIYKEKFIDETYLFMIYIEGKEAVHNFFKSNICINVKPYLTALTRNLKTIRFIFDYNQYEMARILGISNKTYSYYENNAQNYTLNTYNACNILSELFEHTAKNKSYNENLYKNLKLLFVQRNDEDNKIISDILHDYCIAIKYGQSKITIDHLENIISEIELATECNLPLNMRKIISQGDEQKQTDFNDTDETIFN